MYHEVEMFLRELSNLGVMMSACAGNMRVYEIEDKIDKQLIVADDAATVVAEHVSKGLELVTF